MRDPRGGGGRRERLTNSPSPSYTNRAKKKTPNKLSLSRLPMDASPAADVWPAVFLTVAAACVSAVGKALQKSAARRLPRFSRHSLAAFARDRAWASGVALDVVGAVLQIRAYAVAPGERRAGGDDETRKKTPRDADANPPSPPHTIHTPQSPSSSPCPASAWSS